MSSLPASEPGKRPNLRGDAAALKYLDGMSKQGELVPGAPALILSQIQRLPSRVHLSPPGLDLLARAATFVAGPFGKKYLNSQYEPIPGEPELKAVLRRLGLPQADREDLFDAHACRLAGQKGSLLMSSVWRILDVPQFRAYLGYEQFELAPRDITKPAPDGSLEPHRNRRDNLM
jgi:hypothetical protein